MPYSAYLSPSRPLCECTPLSQATTRLPFRAKRGKREPQSVGSDGRAGGRLAIPLGRAGGQALRPSKLAAAESGSAALTCGKPPAFRLSPAPPSPLRRPEGCAFRPAKRRLSVAPTLRKGVAFPQVRRQSRRSPLNEPIGIRTSLVFCTSWRQRREEIERAYSGTRCENGQGPSVTMQ